MEIKGLVGVSVRNRDTDSRNCTVIFIGYSPAYSDQGLEWLDSGQDKVCSYRVHPSLMNRDFLIILLLISPHINRMNLFYDDCYCLSLDFHESDDELREMITRIQAVAPRLTSSHEVRVHDL